MRQGKAKGSQLINYLDGTLYHIDLKKADNIPTNLFLVGAAERVNAIAKHFNSVQFRHQNKARPEFNIICGAYKGVPMAAMSCGIGVAGIEIALTELHALWEFDPEKNRWSDTPASVNIIRVGTAGTSLADVPLGALAISEYAIGLDNLGVFYPRRTLDVKMKDIARDFQKTKIGTLINFFSGFCCYVSPANSSIVSALGRMAVREFLKNGESVRAVASGITTASPGFFAPEGRTVGRIQTLFSMEDFIESMANFESGGLRIVNHEMETSILFRLANEMLGYRAGAICTVLDNLASDQMIDAAYAAERIGKCILVALEAMVELAGLRA